MAENAPNPFAGVGAKAAANVENIFAKGGNQAVKVAVRCRPPLEHEAKVNTFEKLIVDAEARGVR
jgi:hypothetical protein